MEPASILAILVLNAAVGVWQSRSAQDSLDALKKLQPDNACVVRDGELKTCTTYMYSSSLPFFSLALASAMLFDAC